MRLSPRTSAGRSQSSTISFNSSRTTDPLAGNRHPGRVLAEVPQPVHEPAQAWRGRRPVQPARLAPGEVQRQPGRVRLCRVLRPIPTQPNVQQELVGRRDHSVSLVDHRPIARPGRQEHRKRSELSHHTPVRRPSPYHDTTATISDTYDTPTQAVGHATRTGPKRQSATPSPPRRKGLEAGWVTDLPL